MPESFAELTRIYGILESHYRDMQDMEFTVEKGKLWMLQTRNGKRTAKAALRIAVDLAAEGLITRDEAIGRVEPGGARPAAAPDYRPEGRAQGDRVGPAGLPGRGDRRDRLQFRGRRGAPARPSASASWCASRPRPEDIHGMHAAEGILTTRGGMTSHAAVVARGMGKPCVSGVGSIRIDYKAQTLTVGDVTLKAGDGSLSTARPGRSSRAKSKMLRAGAVRRLRDPDGMGRRDPHHEGAGQR